MAYARAVGQAELRTRLRARARAAGARDEEGEDGGEEEEDDDDDDEEEEEEAEEEALLAEAEGLKLHLSSGSTTGYKGVRKHIPSRLAASKRVATRGAGPSTSASSTRRWRRRWPMLWGRGGRKAV